MSPQSIGRRAHSSTPQQRQIIFDKLLVTGKNMRVISCVPCDNHNRMAARTVRRAFFEDDGRYDVLAPPERCSVSFCGHCRYVTAANAVSERSNVAMVRYSRRLFDTVIYCYVRLAFGAKNVDCGEELYERSVTARLLYSLAPGVFIKRKHHSLSASVQK